MDNKNRSALAAAGKQFRIKNISERVQKIVISPIKEMSILADKWQKESGNDIISFGQGIPYWDTPEEIKQGIIKSLEEIDTAKYTLEPGITELRNMVAREIEKNKGAENVMGEKEIMISSGCQEALACALLSVIDPGDEVLLLEPAFASHIEQITQFGGVVKFVPMVESQHWGLDIKKLKESVTPNTKAILFSNPSNPTGHVLTKEELKVLAEVALENDLIIISDETYDFLSYDETEHVSLVSFPEIRDRIILCGSFSKKYALTGYRIGFAFADEGIIDHMLKVHDALAICAPAISQKAAITALKSSSDSVKEAIEKLTYNRKLMCDKLDQLGDIFSYQKPMGSYYIFVKYNIPEINSFDLALKILYEANVVVIPGEAFGPSGERHIRFSFAGEREKIEEGFKRLNKWKLDFFTAK